MKFLIAVMDTASNTGTPEEMHAIDAFNASLQEGGNLIGAWGIAAPSASTVIDARGATPAFTTGPAVASREFMSGVWVIEATSPDHALDLATAASRSCNRKVELRPMLGN